MFHHKPLLSMSGAAEAPAILQILTEVAVAYDSGAIPAQTQDDLYPEGSSTDPTVFRRLDSQQRVAVNIFGVSLDEADNATANYLDDFVVTLQRSLDDGETWLDLEVLTGAQAKDILYTNGQARWRFVLTTKGVGDGVCVQAIG